MVELSRLRRYRDRLYYLLAGLLLLLGIVAFFLSVPTIIPLLALIGSIATGIYGRHRESELKAFRSAFHSILEEKEDLADELRTERHRKQIKSTRLDNLKKILDRQGVDTEYLIQKYGKNLNAILMVLTHFKSPEYNSEFGEEVIRGNLDDLEASVLQGGAKVIPPSMVDQTISTHEELRDWFHANVLDGRDDLEYKLELVSTIDLGLVYGEDTTSATSNHFGMKLIGDILDLENVLSTEELVDILQRYERISLEDELRDNIAILALPYASKTQFDEVLDAQDSIQAELGEISQIANADVAEIVAVLRNHDIRGADGLAEDIRLEAAKLVRILD